MYIPFKLSLLAALSALSSIVAAGYYYPTYPIGADSLTSGQQITITWKPSDDFPAGKPVPAFDLYFMTGGNAVQTTVAKIGTFQGTQFQIPYTVPQTAPGAYFLMFTPTDGSGETSWSTRFSINGGNDWYPSGVATGRDPSSDETPTDSEEPTEEPTDDTSSEISISNNSTSVTPTSSDASSVSITSKSSKKESTDDGKDGDDNDNADGDDNAGDNGNGDNNINNPTGGEGKPTSETAKPTSSATSKSSKRSSSSSFESESESDEEGSALSLYTPQPLFSSLFALTGAALVYILAL
ncbi:hypothetical protein H4219_001705 [Mycoemilia scoparia]|uniref:Ser-Thr-rich glycosyl-phosphatidyl-inositol-anchored membrane family-domain-containing protein n=1 Tax=Mycoemilia scoparia TaxID=417184 RepID=A0A9W8A0F1_9FUNG|nr:hypothetical protein H4219_001705 [Mycoemilia scoparia]